jgi:hypothetical protein
MKQSVSALHESCQSLADVCADFKDTKKWWTEFGAAAAVMARRLTQVEVKEKHKEAVREAGMKAVHGPEASDGE